MKQCVTIAENDFIQFEQNRKMLIEYLNLQFKMKEKREGEQQPLAEDVITIEDNISDLRSKADEIKVSIIHVHGSDNGSDRIQYGTHRNPTKSDSIL
jgi:hypothetical protein